MRLVSQANKLADKLDKMKRQDARLGRKIASLESEEVRHDIMLSDARTVIWMADYAAKEYDQNQLVMLVDQVEAKTREANLSRAKAYDLALSGIDHRTHGNKTQLNQELRKVECWIDEATILDVEIAENSSQLMRLIKRIKVAECQGRREQAVKEDLE